MEENNIEIKSVVNLRKAAFIVKELSSFLNDIETDTSVDAFLHPENYREKLASNTNNTISEYQEKLALSAAIAELREQIQEENYANRIHELLNELAQQHARLRIIERFQKSMTICSYTDEEIQRMISRQEKKEESDSYYGSGAIRISDEKLKIYFEKEEKTTKKKIRSIQDELTTANMTVVIELSDRVVDMIIKYDIMD